ncbi:hypothetical protein F8S13_25940 [Chloroflexia bacterium SDU3-3]|nr:hypothetical protein F8S13_25940 [Chloroflexia bacterium SDU3-3]
MADAHYWLWLDEVEESDKSPYTLSFKGNSSQTKIFYLEEHKDIFEARYFIVHGDDVDRPLAQIRATVALYSDAELLERCAQEGDARARGSAIYQLGIALTARPFDAAFLPAFERAMADPEPNLRIAALWGIAYPHWPELRPLVEAAARDADAEVRRVAGRLLEVYAAP